MKLDPGMHIGLHLVFFGKSGVTHLQNVTTFFYVFNLQAVAVQGRPVGAWRSGSWARATGPHWGGGGGAGERKEGGGGGS
jgi:hypothetical protein